MAIELRPMCVCEVCHHEWLKKGEKLPLQCPHCHSRQWNGDKVTRQEREKRADQISEDW